MRVRSDWVDVEGRFLTSACPLPLDCPFTPSQASDWGLSRNRLSLLVREGYLRRVLRGVYAACQAPDDVAFRAAALALVVPRWAVVTDRSAAWLHGIDVLSRLDREGMPVQCFDRRTGRRLRRDRVASGERRLAARDVESVHGIAVTTPLRTAADLSRLLWKYDALGAVDGFLRIGVDRDRLIAELARFKGYRGIRQARAIVVLGDPRAESMAESATRLHWIEAGLPTPQLQIPVVVDGRVVARLDLGDPEVGYAVEYDGVEFHSEPDQVARDERRRAWLQDIEGWRIDVLLKGSVYGLNTNAGAIMMRGYAEARRTLRTRGWVGRIDGSAA